MLKKVKKIRWREKPLNPYALIEHSHFAALAPKALNKTHIKQNRKIRN